MEERPDEINNRTSFGHWEIDTSLVLLSIDERLTRKRHLLKIPLQSRESVRLRLEKIAGYYSGNFENVFKSVTSDNDSEFIDLASTCPNQQKYTTLILIPLIKEDPMKGKTAVFSQKGRSFDNVTEEQIAFVENWINNLPRKIFNYHFSNSLFQNVLCDITI